MTETETYDNPDQNDAITLSEEGIVRREAMLGELVDTMHGHHRAKRRRRQALASALGIVVVASALALVWSNGSRPVPSEGTTAQNRTTSEAHETTKHAAIVKTDATTIDRWSVQSRSYTSTVIVTTRRTSSVTIIDDAQLLEALAAVDPGAGVMQIGRQTILTGFPSLDETGVPTEDSDASETGAQVVTQIHTTT